jgi:hypothetical protein
MTMYGPFTPDLESPRPKAAPVAGPLIAGLLVLCGSLAYRALFLVVEGFPVYLWLGLWLGAAFACGLLALAGWFLREIRKWRSVAVVQILVACAAGSGLILALIISPISLGGIISAVIGVGSAVFTAVNGIAKFSDLQRARESRPA